MRGSSGGQEAHERHQQQRGVERVAAVVLGEHAALVDAVGADVGLDLVGGQLPLGGLAVLAASCGEPRAAVDRDPAHDLRRGEVLRLAAHLPDAAVGLAPVLERLARPACSRIGQIRLVEVVARPSCAGRPSRAARPRRRAAAGRRRRCRSAPGARPRSPARWSSSSPSSSRSPPMPYMICRSSSPLGDVGDEGEEVVRPPSRSRACTGPTARTSRPGSRCSGSPSCARRRASRAARWWPRPRSRRSARRSGP